jgi:HD-GYP domain-containing protein (c-di-GMP phosphodiesterase class II)
MTGHQLASKPSPRLAELIGVLSVTTDLATGQPLEHGLRRALLAVWLGQALGVSGEQLSNAYYVSLLGSVGCVLEGAAYARFMKDDIAFNRQIVMVDPTRKLKVAAFALGKAGEGDQPVRRARKVMAMALQGPNMAAVVCRDVALQIGELLNIGPGIRQAIGQCHEHWDGKGAPRRLKGEEIHLSARLFQVAHDAEIYGRIGGADAAMEIVRRRSGKVHDPTIAARFCELAPQLLTNLNSIASWDSALEAEPEPLRRLSLSEFEEVATTIGDFVDLRSHYTLGHSAAVAAIAASAAERMGMTVDEARSVKEAGLLHDLGRAGVPISLWESSERLSPPEWERVKTHPSLTELVLSRSASLGHLASLVGMHHERLDGSGYRGVTAPFFPVAAQILAAADVYRTKVEPRPHRAALTPEAACEDLRALGRTGKLDAQVIDAVQNTVGVRVRRTGQAPAGLTEREVEVLRLASRGLSNKEIGRTLVISPKTVGHHLQHIFDKTGVSTRVGAALFAVHHNLLEEEP